MAKKITVIVDKIGNTVDVWFVKPRKAICEETEEEFIVKKDVKTGAVIGFEIFNVFKPKEEVPDVEVLVKTPEVSIK